MLDAEELGKGPALCDPRSIFRKDYQSCVACAQGHGIAAANGTYLAPQFAPILEYCDIKAMIVTVTMSAPVANTVLYETKTTIINIPANFTANATIQTSSFNNVPPTTGSHPTATAPASGTGSGQPTSSQDGGGKRQSQAWISGPIIGSVVGVALIMAATTLLLRKRRKLKTTDSQDRGNDPEDKPQLHSDCIPKPELDNSEKNAPVELPETNLAGTAGGPYELPDSHNPVELEAPNIIAEAPPGEYGTTRNPQGS
ncbi:glycoprotein X [Apiospora sp. TS-2023a]